MDKNNNSQLPDPDPDIKSTAEFRRPLPFRRGVRLSILEGIGNVYAGKLSEAGIKSTNALLSMGATPQDRKEIAKNSGVSNALILEWVNHIDLFRIKGVFEEYADLLNEAGVDTVPELAQRNPENLYNKLVEVNLEKNLVRQLPGKSQVANWIAQAKQLPRVIFY